MEITPGTNTENRIGPEQLARPWRKRSSALTLRDNHFSIGIHKGDCIRTETPLTLEDAQLVVARYVEHYNTVRLHSAISYVTPRPSWRAVIRRS